MEEEKQDVKYGIVWPTMDEQFKEKEIEKSVDRLLYLEEVPEKRIEDALFGKFNYIIEWDNYLALRVLNKEYKEKVDIIYIDPPYNTGKEDFKYNDTIKKEDGWFHSKWIEFMHKRLLLCKDLLKNEGVILISIDDHSQAPLRLLCDNIFSENNFICQFIWRRSGAGGLRGKFPVIVHEYILCYAKDKDSINTSWYIPYTQKNLKTFKDIDEKGKYRKQPLYNSQLNQTESQNYEIEAPDGSKIKPPPGEGAWRYTIETLKKLINSNQIIFDEVDTSLLVDSNGNESKYYIYVKEYIKDNAGENPSSILSDELPKTYSSKPYLRNMKISFKYAKPVELIKYLLLMVGNKNSLVLDFFAGSGTTGDAVLQLNNQDGGNRTFILCTNQDKENICSDICYPRIKKIIKGYSYETNKKVKNTVKGIPANVIYLIGRTSEEKFCEGNIEVLLDKNKKKVGKYLKELVKIKEETNNIIECTDYYEIYSNKKFTKMVLVCFGFSETFTPENLENLIKKENNENIEIKYYLPEEFLSDFRTQYNYPNDIFNDFLLGGEIIEI